MLIFAGPRIAQPISRGRSRRGLCCAPRGGISQLAARQPQEACPIHAAGSRHIGGFRCRYNARSLALHALRSNFVFHAVRYFHVLHNRVLDVVRTGTIHRGSSHHGTRKQHWFYGTVLEGC